MKTMKPPFTLSKQVVVAFILVALCVLTCSGCDNFYDALKFGEEDADGEEDLAESNPVDDPAVGNLVMNDLTESNSVLIQRVDLDHFSITVDDGAPLPTPTEGLEDATQFTMASDGFVNFGESGSIAVQTNDIVRVQGSSQTGTVTIIRPHDHAAAADGMDDLAESNSVLIQFVDLDHFSITVDDGAPLPTRTEGPEDATQFTMASGGFVNFGESGSIAVQAHDIVRVQGSSQTETVTIIRPTITTPTTPP